MLRNEDSVMNEESIVGFAIKKEGFRLESKGAILDTSSKEPGVLS